MSSGMGNETKKLETEIDVLKKRIEYLEKILDQAGIPYDVEQNSEPEVADNSVEAIHHPRDDHTKTRQLFLFILQGQN